MRTFNLALSTITVALLFTICGPPKASWSAPLEVKIDRDQKMGLPGKSFRPNVKVTPKIPIDRKVDLYLRGERDRDLGIIDVGRGFVPLAEGTIVGCAGLQYGADAQLKELEFDTLPAMPGLRVVIEDRGKYKHLDSLADNIKRLNRRYGQPSDCVVLSVVK